MNTNFPFMISTRKLLSLTVRILTLIALLVNALAIPISMAQAQSGEIELFASGLWGPFGLAFDDAGNLYVANEIEGGDGISKIPLDGNVTTFTTGLTGASGLAFNNLGELYTSDDTNRIFHIDFYGTAAVFIDETVGLQNPNAIAFDSANNLYVASAGGFISKFDLNGGLLDLRVADGFDVPQAVVVDEANGRLFISDFSGQIYQIDLSTGNSAVYVDIFRTGSQGGLAMDADGNLFYSAYEHNEVLRIDAVSQNVTVCLSGISQPRGLAFDASGWLYVTSYDTGEIYRVADCAPPITTDEGLISYWNFDEGSGSTAVDTAPAGYLNTGTLINDPQWVSSPFGSALSFNAGSDQYVSMLNNDDSLSIPSGGITITAWINAYDVSGVRNILAKDKEATTSRGNYSLAVVDGKLRFGFSQASDYGDNWIDTQNTISPNRWYFVAITHTFGNSVTTAIYIDGDSQPLSAWQCDWGCNPDSAPATFTDPLYIGKSICNGENFDGLIDEVRIYNRVLSPEEFEYIPIDQPSYNPSFSVRITENQVHGYEWPLGSPVDLFIDGAYFDTQTVTQADWDPNQTFVWFDLDESLTLQAGQIIEMTDGTTAKTHTVTGLVVTGVDVDADTVYGTAESGSQVDIGHIYCDEYGCYGFRREFADSSGNWLADFSVPGEDDDEQDIVDITPGMGNEARQCDEDGDCTQYGWETPPNPWFLVRTDQDQVHTTHWPLGTFLTLTVDDPATPDNPDFVEYGTVTEGDSFYTAFNFELHGVFDIQPGFLVKVSDGTTELSLVVSSLTILGVDLEADTVWGTAESGTELYMEIPAYESEQGVIRHEVADQDGNWLADFSQAGDEPGEEQTYDIGPGDSGEAYQNDQEASTYVSFDIPNPNFSARITENQVHGYEWILGANVTLFVDGNEIGTQTVTEADWDPNQTFVWFDLSESLTLQAGQIIEMTDGTLTKSHTVTSLEVTGVDPDADTVYGMAEPGGQINVGIHCPDCSGRSEFVDATGSWVADFSQHGDEDWEQNTFDLHPGDRGDANQCDEDGDCTQVEWWIPNPTFGVRANDDRIEGWEWPEGATLTITIDDPVTSVNPDASRTATVGTPEWDPNRTWFELHLWDVIDIQPGFLVTVTDGVTTKEHTVLDLVFTEIDIDADVVYGFGVPNSLVNVWICDDNGYCVNREEFTDNEGNWSVDFSVPGDQDWEQETADLGPGSWIDSSQSDEDGDQTLFGMNVLNYTLHAVPTYPEVHGHDWPEGADVTLIIDDDTDLANGALYTQTKNADDDPWCGYPCFDLAGVFDLQVGQYVTMTDGNVSKTVQVSVLTITEVDHENEVLRGIADPGSRVAVNIWSQDGLARYVTTQPDGTWEADFSVFGDEDFEQFTTDIVPGDHGRAIQLNPDGSDDGTLEYWYVPFNQSPSDVVITAPIDPVPITDLVTVQVDFNDPDEIDDHTVMIDWGDTNITNATVSGLTALAEHQYQAAGVYTIEATVTDSFGETAVATYQYVVIYNPNGGFVTGGGWIWSPEGAYIPDLSLTGKATFGFVSKYKKGTDVPTGNTEFQFKVADLTFKSTSYDWLVIAGSKAMYKGTGTINGVGEYGFMISAIDGSPDKFRIKIWDKTTEVVVYDNQLGAADDTDPVAELGGGSIVVHKK